MPRGPGCRTMSGQVRVEESASCLECEHPHVIVSSPLSAYAPATRCPVLTSVWWYCRNGASAVVKSEAVLPAATNGTNSKLIDRNLFRKC
eukprot:3482988-Rhodomonas_salina.1